VLVMMLVGYGYPLGQFFFLKSHTVPAVEVTRLSVSNGAP